MVIMTVWLQRPRRGIDRSGSARGSVKLRGCRNNNKKVRNAPLNTPSHRAHTHTTHTHTTHTRASKLQHTLVSPRTLVSSALCSMINNNFLLSQNNVLVCFTVFLNIVDIIYINCQQMNYNEDKVIYIYIYGQDIRYII